MEYTRITDTGHPLFRQAWELYKKSFPAEERRQLRTQKKIMNRQPYHFDLVTDGGMLVGILLWWGFDDVRYIEHLATLPRLRGKGHGKRILERFVAESDIPVLLEVEHPVNETGRRRIGFYQRAGFVLNAHEYRHPPYKKGGGNVSLMLMTCPEAIDGDAVRRFCEKYHPVIHEFVMKTIDLSDCAATDRGYDSLTVFDRTCQRREGNKISSQANFVPTLTGLSTLSGQRAKRSVSSC